MKTRILAPTLSNLVHAAAVLRNGGLVAFPTETVYGLGANALNPDAAEGIFKAKGRPSDNPLISHIADESGLQPLIKGAPNATARKLMDAFWPGAMTLIFNKSDSVSMRVTAGLDTVAIRMPSNCIARELIYMAGVPVAAPSANRSGKPSPTKAMHVFEDMNGRIPLIIDGGECAVGLESTVIDVTRDVPKILRPGGVTYEMIVSVAGACEIDQAVMHPLGEGERPSSPGMKYRHYAPHGKVTIVRGANAVNEIVKRYDECEGVALILALDTDAQAFGNRRVISLGADADAVATRLFSALREADDMGADVILSEAVDERGIGLAVMNRLDRAAGFDIIDVD